MEKNMVRKMEPRLKDQEEDDKDAHHVRMKIMTPNTTAKTNTLTTKSPPKLHKMEANPARENLTVKQLTQLFNVNPPIKNPPPPPSKVVKSEVAISEFNGRRPSKKITGQGDISCGRDKQ